MTTQAHTTRGVGCAYCLFDGLRGKRAETEICGHCEAAIRAGQKDEPMSKKDDDQEMGAIECPACGEMFEPNTKAVADLRLRAATAEFELHNAKARIKALESAATILGESAYGSAARGAGSDDDGGAAAIALVNAGAHEALDA